MRKLRLREKWLACSIQGGVRTRTQVSGYPARWLMFSKAVSANRRVARSRTRLKRLNMHAHQQILLFSWCAETWLTYPWSKYQLNMPHVGLLYLLISMVQVLSPGLISNYQYDISWLTAFLKIQQPALIKWYKPGLEHLCMESIWNIEQL